MTQRFDADGSEKEHSEGLGLAEICGYTFALKPRKLKL